MQKLFSLFITTFIFACLLGVVFGQFIKIDFLQTLSPTSITPTPTPPTVDCNLCENKDFRKFFYHRIILFGEDETKQPFVAKLQLSRKQLSSNQYEHIYNSTLFLGGKSYEDYDYFKNSSNEIQINKLFDKFSANRESGQTTQENYSLVANLAKTKFNIEITDIKGDFIVKDTEDYIRIMSEGPATLSFGNKTFQARGFVDRIISNDYSKSIFFEGRERLSHETHSIAFWDTNKNFYLIDFTQSNSPDLPYESHKWVIYKDYEGYTTKVFDGTLDFRTDQNKDPNSWNFNIPDLETTVNLTVKQFYKDEGESGILEGQVVKNNIKTSVKGYFTYLNVQ